jgi:putative transcriptional regulator
LLTGAPVIDAAPAAALAARLTTLQEDSMPIAKYCLALAAGLLVALAARAADPSGSPVVLVAKPGMGEFYRNSVLFARPVGGGRHVGFVVNRPTPVTLAALFPEHVPSQKLTDPVFLGGPLHADSLFAVIRRDESPGGRSIPLAKDMFLVMDVETVDRVIEQNRNDARFYVGLVLWQPGELESEVERGFWYVLDHDAALVFRKTTDGLWEELVRRSSQRVM